MLRVFNPACGEYLCEIINNNNNDDKKRRKSSSSLLKIYIKEQLRMPSSQSLQSSLLTLYMAPIKKQRIKILLEKVTELGYQ